MKVSGWIFMVISWGIIIGLLVFCFKMIFKKGVDNK